MNETTGFWGRPAWAEIDLDAIAHNVRALKQHVGERTQVMAVVKANAYGHGAEAVARMALASGASWLGVNLVDEGVQLRRAGLPGPILVLGHCPPWEAAKAVDSALTPTVTTMESALAVAEAASQRRKVIPVHLKVDTGMGRYGLLVDEVLPFARQVAGMATLRLEGLWTHFASADEADKGPTWQQFQAFQSTLTKLEENGITVPIRHVANSAAALDLPETHLDVVRCGISIYGLYPSPEVSHALALRPAMSLKARIVRVRSLPAGTRVGYGRTWEAQGPCTVALVPLGYADGCRRSLSNRGTVLVGGERAPVIGRVSMDQITLDVSDIPGVQQYDEAVLVGRQGQGEISADEVACLLDTINYEVVAALAARVPRVYVQGGRVVAYETLVSGHEERSNVQR